jgi:hypothetical protein
LPPAPSPSFPNARPNSPAGAVPADIPSSGKLPGLIAQDETSGDTHRIGASDSSWQGSSCHKRKALKLRNWRLKNAGAGNLRRVFSARNSWGTTTALLGEPQTAGI